jgi:hypothetical protein
MRVNVGNRDSMRHMKEMKGDLPRAHYSISHDAFERQYMKTVQFLLNIILKLTTRIWTKQNMHLLNGGSYTQHLQLLTKAVRV